MDNHTNITQGNPKGIEFIESTKLLCDGEHYLPYHCFSYIMSGTLTLSDGTGTQTFRKGDFMFGAGNRLVKVRKAPEPDGLYKAVVVVLDEEMLQTYCKDYGLKERTVIMGKNAFPLQPTALLKNYFDSLFPYFDKKLPENLVSLKRNEAVMLLINENPKLSDILFNFSAPGKINLEEFMNQNFRYNTQMKRYAYLTGRSLATFKRDFQKTFNTTPNRWLQQKRLDEAYYLIKEKGQKPSEVYLEVGFETLSHFSDSFKKKFGMSPSMVRQHSNDYVFKI